MSGMTFAHLGWGMRNGKAYSKLYLIGKRNENSVPNSWDWEREIEKQFPEYRFKNCHVSNIFYFYLHDFSLKETK